MNLNFLRNWRAKYLCRFGIHTKAPNPDVISWVCLWCFHTRLDLSLLAYDDPRFKRPLVERPPRGSHLLTGSQWL